MVQENYKIRKNKKKELRAEKLLDMPVNQWINHVIVNCRKQRGTTTHDDVK